MIGMLIAVLLMAACKSSDSPFDENEECYLTVYVYEPGNPILTRADEEYKNATEDENKIHTLQLWVFKKTDDEHNGELVGYLEDTDVNLISGSTYKIIISHEFAEHPTNVDVYAVANVTNDNCGCTFTQLTTRADLDAAVLQGDSFGAKADDQSVVRPVVQTVPPDGLPMTAVLKNKAVEGTFPALRIIDSPTNMSTLYLTRAVSKLRFLLGNKKKVDPNSTEPTLTSITSITLNGVQIPNQEYLMLNVPFDRSLTASPLGEARFRIKPNDYFNTPINFGSIPVHDASIDRIDVEDIPTDENPLRWIMGGDPTCATETHAEYMVRIENALNHTNTTSGDPEPLLLEFGKTYLRESDKCLKGVIKYRVSTDATDAPDNEIEFEMSNAGDFTRNHSWTILVLYDGNQLRIKVVNIGVREWNQQSEVEKFVYNW